MKTNEFVRQLEAMGYDAGRTLTLDGVRIFRITESDRLIAIVTEEEEFQLDTKFAGFRLLPPFKKINLYKLLDAYARTPLEERKEPKKYIYKFPFTVRGHGYDKEKCIVKIGFMIQLDGSGREHALKTQDFHFTDAEVEAYPEDIQALFRVCKKEEVECE